MDNHTEQMTSVAPHFAYIGCRTTRARGAMGQGIVRLVNDGREWSVAETLQTEDNPSWLARGTRADRIYSVHGDFSSVSSFACDPETGELRFLSCASCGGLNPVHLCATASGRSLLCANYATGTVAVLPIDGNGCALDVRATLAWPFRQGPHRIEQKGPHPHQVVMAPKGDCYLIPDKGGDRVVVLSVDDSDQSPVIGIVSTLDTRECAGPRHLVFHPELPIVYVVGELDSTVLVCAWDGDARTLHPIQRVSTLPADFCGESRAAAIDITADGRWLYISNRGHDSVSAFSVSEEGLVGLAEVFATGGKVPRCMTIDPQQKSLWIAHEGSHYISIRSLDSQNGLDRRESARIETPSPTSILFAPAR